VGIAHLTILLVQLNSFLISHRGRGAEEEVKEKSNIYVIQEYQQMSNIKTLCPYCGVGCGLEVSLSEDNSISKVRGDKSHPSNQGMVCVKGATIAEALDKDRLLYPMMRGSLNEEFRRVSWEEALDRIVSRIQSVRLTQGADAICMYGSGQLQTEDYYI
jgi:ferredoxin-nitrate reductase